MEKVAEANPDGIVTVDGTLATEAFEVANATTTPFTPADPVRVTVPVAVLPPNTVPGLIEMLLRAAKPGASVAAVAIFENGLGFPAESMACT
jgi:hypothetical protein